MANKTAVYILRGQPLHNQHVATIVEALCDPSNRNLVVVFGSTNDPASTTNPDLFLASNPFSFEERKAMLFSCIQEKNLPEEIISKMHICGLVDYKNMRPDSYDLTKEGKSGMIESVGWYHALRDILEPFISDSEPSVAFYGCNKDALTGDYLQQIRSITLEGIHYEPRFCEPSMRCDEGHCDEILSATQIREVLLKPLLDKHDARFLFANVPKAVLEYLNLYEIILQINE
jgi:hypothetical protein